jgi:hypothetical protein
MWCLLGEFPSDKGAKVFQVASLAQLFACIRGKRFHPEAAEEQPTSCDRVTAVSLNLWRRVAYDLQR